jgi:PAS domain S-box-containing protein
VRALDENISSAAVPESMVRYVARTREQVIIDDVSVSNPFSTDEYLREKRTCSVLCLPLLKQGELVALLYLENKLASNVFTPARLKILEVLASQAAISLENSRLYHKIQRAEEAVRRSEKQLSDVIETMPAIAFTLRPDGSPEFVNRRFTEYTGLKAEEVGLYRRKTIHPEDIEGYINKWQASLTSGEPVRKRSAPRRADGQYRWFLVRGVPLRNEHGSHSQVVWNPDRILKIASKQKRDFGTRTSFCVRISSTRRCSKRSLAPQQCCETSSHRSPKSQRQTRQF